jgi:hypothetical protein
MCMLPEAQLQKAEESGSTRKRGGAEGEKEPWKLHGVVNCHIKMCSHTRITRYTASSNILRNYYRSYIMPLQSERLLAEEANIIGPHIQLTTNSLWVPPTKTPAHGKVCLTAVDRETKVPGWVPLVGRPVAVQADICMVSPCSDTGRRRVVQGLPTSVENNRPETPHYGKDSMVRID